MPLSSDLAHPGLAAVERLQRLAVEVQGTPDGRWFVAAVAL
jgi:hypothetical protein